MKRKFNINYFILFLSLVFMQGCEPAKKSVNKKCPNIILVITDDQGYGDLSCLGSPDVATPNIDKLYEQSIRFTDFQASPTCAPTRSAIMTGKVPFKNGITHTIFERERMALENVTLAQRLKSLGYTTGIFGKWHLGDEPVYQPDQRGFDEVFIHGAGGIGQKYPGSCADAPNNNYFDPVIKHNGTFVKTKGFCTDIFFTQALGWIKKHRHGDNKPFFAYIATNAPHSPYFAPDEYKKKFIDTGYGEDAQGFYGMVENIDFNMGLLLQKLDEWNLSENTVLIFMSDNGKAMFRNNDKTGKGYPDTYNAGMKGYKGSVYEGGTRVPVFIRLPGERNADKDIPVLASHFDLFPTLIGIAGGKIPQGIDGISLLPLINGVDKTWGDRCRFFHKGRWEPGENPDDYKYKGFAVRNERYRLINNEELYDIKSDPGEKNNVIKDYPQIASKMMEAYNKWWEEVRPCMVNEDYKYEQEEPPFYIEYYKQKGEIGIPEWELPEL